MKSLFLLLLTYSFCIITSCTNDNNNDSSIEIWNLRHVSGGIAGINNNFNQGLIIWKLNPQNSTLTVENNNSDGNYDGLDSGTYSYTIQSNSGNSYIIIDSNEFGGITSSQNELIIDQNMTSNGSGADGFILRFEN